MTYSEALEYVAHLGLRGWRMGLDRMEALVEKAGLQEACTRLKYVHVAGTNGKGSVTATVQSILAEAGYRVGGYFSPYVYNIRERIQMDGRLIEERDFARMVAQLRPIAESFSGSHFGEVSEFEFKTAMGLAYWQEQRAEWVALEVGLGGRLDATNVVTPVVCAIVSIGLDHVSILGESLREIALEKAGILKPGLPAVVGPLADEARQAIEERASNLGVPLWRVGQEIEIVPEAEGWTVRTPQRAITGLRPALPGRHQVANLAVAIGALEAAGLSIEPAALRRGVEQTRIAGRFERRHVREKLVILDGAHNRESMEALIETLRSEYPRERFAIVFGMLEGHDPGPVARALEMVAAEIHLSPIDFRRTRDPKDLADQFSLPTIVHTSVSKALDAALASELPVLITGSFYLVGEAGNSLDQ